MAATRGGLALIWKIVLVVELLGRSDGIGFQLHMAFQVFDVASILAYSLAFIAVVQLIELALLQPLERRASAWREAGVRHAELRLNGPAAGYPVLGVIEGRVCRRSHLPARAFRCRPDHAAQRHRRPRAAVEPGVQQRAGLRIGYLFQEHRLLPWRTVRQNLALVGASPTDIERLLAEVGLSGAADSLPDQLSLGMARRAALARCLAIEPDLLLLDEPFASLDAERAAELRGLIARLLDRHPGWR